MALGIGVRGRSGSLGVARGRSGSLGVTGVTGMIGVTGTTRMGICGGILIKSD